MLNDYYAICLLTTTTLLHLWIKIKHTVQEHGFIGGGAYLQDTFLDI